ncbi:MAG: DUF1707 domain-containing protein [Actinobacteria bacterium]|nr:DUF1707 domain-containing protein [Actinomycetota bacterium]
MSSDQPAGGLRLSDADRDHLASALGRHYAAGRLDIDGLSDRLDRIYAAAGRDDAAAVLADLPALEPAGAGGPRPAGRGRHGESSRPEDGWIPTTERFRDPTTRRLMRVWVDPVDGTRHYVAEGS